VSKKRVGPCIPFGLRESLTDLLPASGDLVLLA
jgi:hypothetical protein